MLLQRWNSTSLPTRLVSSVMPALLLVAACSGEAGPPDRPTAEEPPGAQSPAGGAPPGDQGAAILPFTDEFEDDGHGWGGPYQRIEDGDYVWDVPAGQADARGADTLIRVEDQIDDVVVTTSFTAVGMTGVGLQCAFEELEGSSRWYDLELGVDGVSIRKRPLGNAPVETLATNASVTLTERPTELAAGCRQEDGTYLLSLSVDGTVAAEAVDPSPYGRAGAPNLSVRAAPDGGAVPTDHVVRFHRFAVTEHRPA